MYANNKNKIHSLIFITCIFFYIVSPDTSYPVRVEEVQAQEAKTETGAMASGVVTEIQVRGKEDKKESISLGLDDRSMQETGGKLCDAECKIKTLKDIGIRSEIAESLVTNCKAMARDPVLCIKVGASIVTAESSKGFRCKKSNPYNCFGMSVQEDYKSYNDAVIHFVGKFEKYWYKAKDMSHFYSPAGKLPPTRFCVSEDSTGTEIGCPAGLKNSSSTFNKLKSW